MDLKGKVALVTGAAGGIGEAICTALARSGAAVLIHYCHSEAPAKALLDKLRQEGHSCMLYRVDIRSTEAAQAMVNALIAEYGKIDILVNNAGITRDQLLMRMSEADFDEVIATNLKGSWNMIKAASYAMSKARYGKIINISSVAGIAGTPGQSNYAASKAGIIGLTKSVAREFARRNITCNAIAPGFIETKMSAALPEAVREKYLEQIPLARFGRPEEIAALVLYLASDEANYITGQVLQIDGGLAM